MTAPEPPDQPIPARRGRRTLRLTVIGLATLVVLLLGASVFLSGR
jgi:hypothetical protein